MSGKYLVVSIPLVALMAKATAGGGPPRAPINDSLAPVEAAVPRVAAQGLNHVDSDRPSQSSISIEEVHTNIDKIADIVPGNPQPYRKRNTVSTMTTTVSVAVHPPSCASLLRKDERSQRRIEHERRMKMIRDEHAFNEDERRKLSALHEMKVRVLEAKEQVLNLEKEILRKKQQLLAA
ncbi:uncharacterized protein LOC144134215 [Amblyomma americanum]